MSASVALRRLLLLCPLLAACTTPADKPADDTSPEADADTDTDTDADTDADSDTDTDADTDTPWCPTAAAPTCDAGIVMSTPMDGALGVSTLTTIEWFVDPADPAAIAVMEGADGTVTNVDGHVTFTPDLPLSGGREQVARLCWCGGEVVTTFVTADAPHVEPATLVDRTYAFHLDESVIVSPAAYGPALQSVYPETLLLQVRSDEAPLLRMRLAWADVMSDTLEQSTAPTLNVEPSFAASPSFRATADEWVYFPIIPDEAHDVSFLGTFSADGSRVEDGALSVLGEVDTLMMMLGADTPEAACAQLAEVGDRCETCPDGVSSCVRYTWTELVGEEITPFEIEAVFDPE